METKDDFRKQLAGYGLTTANILYRMPDHRAILQSFVWQQYDMHPRFPELHKFLDFWEDKLEAPIQRVTGYDTPYPHSLEWEYFPTPPRIIKAMRTVIEG